MYRIAAEDMAAVVAQVYHQTVLLALLAVRSAKEKREQPTPKISTSKENKNIYLH